MALTMVQIISNSLIQLGHEPISSLADQDALTVSAVSAYELKLPSALAANNWRFATQLVQLSKLNVTPPEPWLSVYQLPAGWLKLLRLYPNIYQWDIFAGNEIFAVYDQELWCEYIFQPDVSMLPAHFVDYFTYEISAYLALTNAEKTEYYAALEQKRIYQLGIAAAIEAQNRPQFTQVSFPVLDNRYVGGIIGNSITS